MNFISKWWLQAKALVAIFLLKRGILTKTLSTRFQVNPLLKYPRNENCWCGSHKKAKHCCLPKQSPVCRREHYDFLKRFMNHVEIMKKS